jgi:hypothetical protein
MMWIKRRAEDLIRMQDFGLRYVDWIDKRERHHHRVFLDVFDVDKDARAVAFAEFRTKREALRFGLFEWPKLLKRMWLGTASLSNNTTSEGNRK